MNEKIIALLKKHEGYRQFVYDDATGKPAHGEGKLTVGYGLNLESRGITESEAEYILNNIVIEIIDRLNVLIPFFPRLDPVRQAVLIDMAYTMGVQGLMGFTAMLNYMDGRKWGQGGDAMANSDWARKPENKKRFETDNAMLVYGQWPEWLK